MKTPALLSATLLVLLLGPGTTVAGSHKAGAKPSGCNGGPTCKGSDQTPITVLVTNSVTPSPNKTYSTYVVNKGILLGGLRRLNESAADFTFTYTEHKDYGPFLDSVNGLYGNAQKHTYWQLLVNTTANPVVEPDVGIGCYIPKANDQIILKYTKWR